MLSIDLVTAAPRLLGLLFLVLQIVASCHVILYKREARSAVLWLGLVWLSPGIGALLYYIIGINRLRRRVANLTGRHDHPGRLEVPKPIADPGNAVGHSTDQLRAALPELVGLADYIGKIVDSPLTGGNNVKILEDGEEAYPAMLKAIRNAEHSVGLCSYIFDNDKMGREFVKELKHAQNRGVAIRVIVDDVGARYSFPSISRELKRNGLPYVRFLPTVLPWRWPYMNLRNHRKIMVIDGRIGFTGGMNIRAAHLARTKHKHATRDLHFQLEGPVVQDLRRIFAKDWYFATREQLTEPAWMPVLDLPGAMIARGIPDGPDEDFEEIRWALLGAIFMATDSIKIMTPYFLPDASLLTSLNVAAISGVRVELILPRRSNLLLVQWASSSAMKTMLEKGCQIYLSEEPFDHSKIMIVDGRWALFGSSNWDIRSLRLNFEFNVEVYDRTFCSKLVTIHERRKVNAHTLKLEELVNRSLLVRLRDGIARLFSPYL